MADTHERLIGEKAAEVSSNRSFGVVFAAFLAIVALWPLLSGNSPRFWSLISSLAFLVVSFVSPSLLHPLNRLWLRFGYLLGRITTPIVLGFLFYGVITPVGLLKRIVSKQDSLHLGFEPQESSYWIKRSPPGPAPETIKHQF